jgi:hypothetical protein
MARDYVFFKDGMEKFGIRPGKVKSDLLKIAKNASILRKSIMDVSPIAWEAESLMEYWFMGDHPAQPIDWVSKLSYLEAICDLAADNPKFHDGGGNTLRAEGRWNGTANHLLVRQCRALLEACGRPSGGSTGGSEAKTLVNLLAAVRDAAYGDGGQFTFTHDIHEVLRWPGEWVVHKLRVAELILDDLRSRMPKEDQDIQEAERVVLEIQKEMPKIIWDERARKMAIDMKLNT